MTWVSKEEEKFWNEYSIQQERYLLELEDRPTSELPVCNKKWAMIEVEGESQMQWVDNITMKAYKRDGYYKTNIEIPEYKFDRWCRPMDL